MCLLESANFALELRPTVTSDICLSDTPPHSALLRAASIPIAPSVYQHQRVRGMISCPRNLGAGARCKSRGCVNTMTGRRRSVEWIKRGVEDTRTRSQSQKESKKVGLQSWAWIVSFNRAKKGLKAHRQGMLAARGAMDVRDLLASPVSGAARGRFPHISGILARPSFPTSCSPDCITCR
jgi:hypothetical protein